MGPDLELKERSNIMVVLDGKENERAFTEPVGNNIRCASNYQDKMFELEASTHQQDEQVNKVGQWALNRTESTHQNENPPTETPSRDTTENSSSFGNTASGDEDDDTLSDSEVMSKLRDDGFGEGYRMRKKRLTSHWRTFIQPYMWRCRWVELQIRRFQSQALKYDLQVEKINRRKHLTSEGSTVDDLCSKSLPFSDQTQREKIMERRKRKRVEDTTDKSAYMAQHNLFSYFGRKRSTAGVASFNDWGNLGSSMDKDIKASSVFGLSDEPVSLEFRDDDNSLEQVLWKIGVVQSHLSELKTRLGKVMTENAKEISSADILSLLVPCNGLTSSAQNNVSANDGKNLVSSSIASELVPKYCKGDAVMPESTMLTRGEGTNLPNIIESTDQPQIGKSRENEGDRHLIYNSMAKELNNVEKVEIQPTVKLETPKEEQEDTAPSVPVVVGLVADDQSVPKRSAKRTPPNNKRKRGRRRAGRWNRRSY